MGVLKNCLKKVVGKAKLNFEELNTVISEIEKCVNSRPLTYLSEEHEDTIITTNHLIYGRDIDRNKSVQHDFHELSGNDMRKRQAYCQVIFKHFAKRFVKQYLLTFRRHIPIRIIKTIVLLAVWSSVTSHLLRKILYHACHGKKSVVNQLITRNDGAVRRAIICTKSKSTKETTFTKQPLQLIVSLEADQLESEQKKLAHGQFGSKRLAAMNADEIRRLTCT